MSTDQASYLLLYPNHGLNNYLVNDNHHTQNAIVPFFTERDQAPFQGLSESRDQPSTTELEHLLEAASPYPPINSWRNHLLTPIQGYEYGAENHQSSNTSGFDEIGTVWLQMYVIWFYFSSKILLNTDIVILIHRHSSLGSTSPGHSQHNLLRHPQQIAS